MTARLPAAALALPPGARMSGCECPDLCGRDHYPDDGCGRRARFIRSTLDGHVYHVCTECADVIVERARGERVARP